MAFGTSILANSIAQFLRAFLGHGPVKNNFSPKITQNYYGKWRIQKLIKTNYQNNLVR